MALNDWNHNGKDDQFDRYMDYQMINESMKKTSDDSGYVRPHRSGSRLSAGTWIVLLIFSIFGWVLAIASCADTSDDDQSYDSNRHEAVYDTERSGATVGSYSKENTYSNEAVPADTYRSDYRHADTADDDDAYDVNGYDDPEDFYEDNQDDFEDEEDAEDYYDEYHE